MIRAGIIGFGLSGRVFHAGLLKDHPDYEIAYVSSSRPDDVQKVLPRAAVLSSPEELISQDIDLVINCAPNSHHFSLSKLALENGKHVVVEKPFTNTVEEARELIALADREELVLSVFQNRRWDSDFLTVKKLIADGSLGEIKQFESHFDRWRPAVRSERWREQEGAGSGIWFDLGAHLVDQALVLFGKPDEVIKDVAVQKLRGAADDYFHVILKYGRIRVILHASSFTNSTPRFQVFGTQGTYTKFGLDPQEEQLRQGLSTRDAKFGRETHEANGILTSPDLNVSRVVESETGRYIDYYDKLSLAIRGGGKIPVPATEALDVIKILTR